YQSFPLQEIIDEATQLVGLTRSGKRVVCESNCPAGLQLVGDKQRLSQVLVNLLTNACDASSPGDQVEVFAIPDGSRIQIEVMDQGVGIPQQERDKIFEPFFTTKAPGEGTGLGLSMVQKIIQEHNGSIEIDSAPNVGTRVIIRLPQHPDGAE
ncbi:MAG: hypothetical protein B0D85_04400, partial [Candidatus Sedimenticola endophacoides]